LPAWPAPPRPAPPTAPTPPGGVHRPRSGRALRAFLYSLIGSLSGAALLAIAIVAVGTEFTSTQAKIIGTAVAVGGFSLLGLCSSTWYDREERVWLAAGGVLSAGAALLMAVITIWAEIGDSDYLRVLFSLVIVAVAWALSSLLFVLHGRDPVLDAVVLGTIVLVALAATLIVVPVAIAWDDVGEGYVRVTAVFVILAVLGSVVSPVLARARKTPG
ncbi:MAG: hypothetical protein ACRD2W_09490, partial [Acidimicrobiales bacterium]